MEIADILTEPLKREDREALLNLHRHLHGLAAQGEVDCDRLTKAHELVAAEITRRGYVHGSELECGKQKGLVLPAPHAFLVWKGKQTAVAASPEFHAACGAKAVDVPLALVCEGEAYGLVTLGTPAVMDCKTFDLPEFTEEHRVRPEERRAWWPEAEKLFVYPIRDFQGFKELQRVDASGDGLCEVRYKQYQPPSEREATVLRQSEKLPKVIVLQPHAVSLTGSVLYGKHEPADTDVVLVGAEWREGEGQFVVPLTPTFKEKLERVLKAVYQTGNPVQYISEGTGATFDHLPLYSLALVRLPRLEVERVSELEPEMAEVGYDKVGVKWSPDQPRDETGRFSGGGSDSPSISTAAQTRLDYFDKTHRGDKIEHCQSIAPDGTTLLVKMGDSNSISLEPDELDSMSGGVFQHNHPSGRSFSIEDVQVAANHNFLEMRAIGVHSPTGEAVNYSVKPKGKSWPTSEAIKLAYDPMAKLVQDETWNLLSQGTITLGEGNANWNHEVWEKIAPGLGLVYEREFLG